MNNKLPEKIIEEIKNRGIEPLPKWRFFLKRSVLWSLAIVTTVLGGIAVAVIIFVFIDHDANARTYLSESIFEDLLRTIPYLWLGALLVLVVITRYAVRRTKSGYRYSTARIIGAVVASSLVLGIGMSAMEVGERVQDFLVLRVPYFDELTSTSKDVWSHPEKGLLGGTVTSIIAPDEIEVTDFHGKKWLVDIGEVDSIHDSLFQPGLRLKMIGVQEDTSDFRAVRVSEWKKGI